MRITRLISTMALAAAATLGLMAVPTAGHANAMTCTYNLKILSFGTNSFARMEPGYAGGLNGMLRASGDLGPESEFARCTWWDEEEDMEVFAIWSHANRLWVSAEITYGGGDNGMLRARAHAIGPWEKFVVIQTGSGDGWYSLANNRFVSAELAYGGIREDMMRARATVVGPWEKFAWV